VIDAPIPGTFLRGSVSNGLVTIAAPSAKVLMLVKDAYAMMHWLYDVLPCSVPPAVTAVVARRKDDIDRRRASYTDLWTRRRFAA
jgi:hypothetical protein